MAVSVDKVYQKVLAIANKEQRGYITPQEFNLFADHAQMDIFEQYFYDLEQRQRATGNEFDYADIVTNLGEKIDMFEIHNISVAYSSDVANISSSFTDLYRLGEVNINYENNDYCTAEQLQLNELNKYRKSPLAIWTKSRPVYAKFSSAASAISIRIYPAPIQSSSVKINYIRRPVLPNWTYLIGSNKNALYNPNAADHKHFELHSSEETNLVVKILQLAGIAIKDFNLVQAAAQEEVKSIQLEKQ